MEESTWCAPQGQAQKLAVHGPTASLCVYRTACTTIPPLLARACQRRSPTWLLTEATGTAQCVAAVHYLRAGSGEPQPVQWLRRCLGGRAGWLWAIGWTGACLGYTLRAPWAHNAGACFGGLPRQRHDSR